MRKLLAVAWALIFISMAGAALADSVLTLPVPEEIFVEGPDFKNVAHMVLRVSIPPKKEQPPPRIVKPKQGFDYFNFNPFPKVTRKQLALITRLAKTGLNTGKFTPGDMNLQLKPGFMNTQYEFFRAARLILKNFLGLSDKDVLKRFRLTRQNLQDIEKLVNEYKEDMDKRLVNTTAVKEKLAHVRRVLELNSGVARVIKVHNADNGDTIIHFMVRQAPEEN